MGKTTKKRATKKRASKKVEIVARAADTGNHVEVEFTDEIPNIKFTEEPVPVEPVVTVVPAIHPSKQYRSKAHIPRPIRKPRWEAAKPVPTGVAAKPEARAATTGGLEKPMCLGEVDK